MALNVAPRTFVLEGGHRLAGTVEVGGSKNATFGAMAAALLVPDECILENVPHIDDVDQMALVMRSVGCSVEWEDEHTLRLNASGITSSSPDPEVVGTLRGSFLVFGALLSRLGEASCPTPGGDIIGQRPIDVHLAGFRALGAETEVAEGMFHAHADTLRGAAFFADYPSVLGTQNTMIAAVCAKGTTTIVNAAAEPEVQSLAAMLNKMGAQIEDAGTHTITIHGVDTLQGTQFRIIPDRIVTGTYAIAAALTGGEVELVGVAPEHMFAPLTKLKDAGVHVETNGDRMTVRGTGGLQALTLQALPYPGFPTDLHAPMAVLMTQAHGQTTIHERVFENRLGYIDDLCKMGADISTREHGIAIITGPAPLTGASLRALDVRAGAAFILAGLAARGRTEVHDIYHVDRGYEKIDEKLRSLGAAIERE